MMGWVAPPDGTCARLIRVAQMGKGPPVLPVARADMMHRNKGHAASLPANEVVWQQDHFLDHRRGRLVSPDMQMDAFACHGVLGPCSSFCPRFRASRPAVTDRGRSAGRPFPGSTAASDLRRACNPGRCEISPPRARRARGGWYSPRTESRDCRNCRSGS